MQSNSNNLPTINFSTLIQSLEPQDLVEINTYFQTRFNIFFTIEELSLLKLTTFSFITEFLTNISTVTFTSSNNLTLDSMYRFGNSFANQIQQIPNVDVVLLLSLIDKYQTLQLHIIDEDEEVPNIIKLQLFRFMEGTLSKIKQIEGTDISEIFPRLAQTQKTLIEKYDTIAISENLTSMEIAKRNLNYLKHVIEFGAYKLFYFKGSIIKKEKILHQLYQLTFSHQPHDVNQNVDNGRGAADFKISLGSADATIVEFKLASNSYLSHLEKQIGIYLKANNTDNALRAIIFFSTAQEKKLMKVLKNLSLINSENVVIIDARKDNKQSASILKNK